MFREEDIVVTADMVTREELQRTTTIGPADLNIAGMVMMLGTASSTYGPSAVNGVLNVSSRSPFDIGGLALQESAKSNEDWFPVYRIAFENGVPIRGIFPDDLRAARNIANSGVTLLSTSSAGLMQEPGTEEFKQAFNRL